MEAKTAVNEAISVELLGITIHFFQVAFSVLIEQG